MQIVWIHGFPLNSQVFEAQSKIRGAEHKTPDLPGFGKQPPAPAIQGIGDYATYVLHSSPKEAVFAGLSMGGYICFAIARMAPERVRGLILIDTKETADTADARKARYDMIEKVQTEGINPVVESMLPKMVVNESLKPKVRQIMESCSKEGVMAALRTMAERPDSSDLLPRITAPTLIVVGEKDTITPPSEAERMKSAMPNASLLEIANAAHLSNMEKPDELNTAVEQFLSRHQL